MLVSLILKIFKYHLLSIIDTIFLTNSLQIVLQICDSDLNILCVDASNPGSTTASGVWQSHPLNLHLKELASNGVQGFLLGLIIVIRIPPCFFAYHVILLSHSCILLTSLKDRLSNEIIFNDLAGDIEYPLSKVTMVPLLNTVEGTPQHLFNLKHATARNTVELCISALKSRFR